jgi:LacI family transcriptional regulator
MTVGHVIPLSKKHEMVNPVFGDFVTGAAESFLASGYDLMLSLVEDGKEEEHYRTIKARGNVDGIIVHGPRMHDSRIELLNELELPFVVHGRATDVTTPYSWIDMNNFRAFCRATEFLITLGHKRIALINGLEFMDFAHRRKLGYLTALESAGIKPNHDYIAGGEMTEEHGYSNAMKMLDLPEPPTAFLTSSLVVALGVRRALQDRNLVMGRDVSIITHDDDLGYLRNGGDVPIFTATRSSVREAGRLGADMLLDMIANPSDTPKQHLLEADMILGGSTGPAPI